MKLDFAWNEAKKTPARESCGSVVLKKTMD